MVEEASFGKRGYNEQVAVARTLDYLRALPQTVEVLDRQQDRETQRRGVDLIWVKKDGTQTTIDVKGDGRAHKTGNFVVELLSVVEQNIPGNFITSKADQWHMHELGRNHLHVWHLPAFRTWFYHATRGNESYITRTTDREGWHTWGLKLPIRDALVADPPVMEVIKLPNPPRHAWVDPRT